jgi:hypothetical protein
MKTEQLIDQLTEKLKPVRVAKLRAGAALLWTLALLGLCLALISVIGVRPDLRSATIPARIACGLLGSVVLLIGAVAGFIRLLIPARPAPVWTVPSLILGALLIAASSVATYGSLGASSLNDWAGLDASGWRCTGTLTLFAFLLSLPMILAARRYAPTELAKAGLFLASAAVSGAFAILLVHCPSDDLVHVVAYHLIPSTLLAAGASTLLARTLRW